MNWEGGRHSSRGHCIHVPHKITHAPHHPSPKKVPEWEIASFPSRRRWLLGMAEGSNKNVGRLFWARGWRPLNYMPKRSTVTGPGQGRTVRETLSQDSDSGLDRVPPPMSPGHSGLLPPQFSSSSPLAAPKPQEGVTAVFSSPRPRHCPHFPGLCLKRPTVSSKRPGYERGQMHHCHWAATARELGN